MTFIRLVYVLIIGVALLICDDRILLVLPVAFHDSLH